MATAPVVLGEDLARKTVFVKLRLGLPGNSRKVSSAQVEVDADKRLVKVSKTFLDSPELKAVRRLDGEIRRYLYGVCLPFEPGIHLLPIGLIEAADVKLGEFRAKREELSGLSRMRSAGPSSYKPQTPKRGLRYGTCLWRISMQKPQGLACHENHPEPFEGNPSFTQPPAV